MRIYNKKLAMSFGCGAISFALLMGQAGATDPALEAEFNAFLQQRQQELDEFSQAEQKQFEKFATQWQAALAAYSAEVADKWQEPALTDKTRWITYSDDLARRRIVDFEKGEVRIEFLKAVDEKQAKQIAEQQVQQILETPVEKALKQDPVFIRANREINFKKTVVDTGVTAKPAKPAAASAVSAKDPGREIEKAPAQVSSPASRSILATDKDVLSVKKEMLSLAEVEKPAPSSSASKKVPQLVVRMPISKAVLSSQGEQYLARVKRESERWQIPAPLIMAVIHTESSFNPMARSHVPAFGLMQIVPVSAGKDVTQFLEGSPRLLNPEYLYQPSSNIEAGSVYLHLLMHRYFAAVEDPRSRVYCAIAAYNTGPGNVSRAFTGKTKLKPAISEINQLTPDQVYQQLADNLPYDETKRYLQKVVKRTYEYRNI